MGCGKCLESSQTTGKHKKGDFLAASELFYKQFEAFVAVSQVAPNWPKWEVAPTFKRDMKFEKF